MNGSPLSREMDFYIFRVENRHIYLFSKFGVDINREVAGKGAFHA